MITNYQKPKISVKKFKKIIKLQQRTIFIIFIKIIYCLFYSKQRKEFITNHQILNKLYEKIILKIARKLKLPVKTCLICGIKFIPDYRTSNKQKCCPYGCVEHNRHKNIKKAKEKYRKNLKNRMKQSEYDVEYRIRLKTGTVENLSETKISSEKKSLDKLTNEIIYIYFKLNPAMCRKNEKKIKKILLKIADNCKNERDTILTFVEKQIHILVR